MIQPAKPAAPKVRQVFDQPKPPLTDKQRLEAAVSQIAKDLERAVKVVETSSELTQEQVQAAFAHISHLLLTSGQKALLSLSIAQTANGGFSLDNLPAAPLPVPGFVMPGAERLVRGGAQPTGGAPARIASLDDDVDFMDDDMSDFN